MDRFQAYPGKKSTERRTISVGAHDYVVDVVRAAASGDQDRHVILEHAGGLFVALADGAGGSGHGREAAGAFVSAMTARPSADSVVLGGAIVEVDDALAGSHGGQTTALSFFVGPTGLVGAGVGDTELWWRDASGWHEGTATVTRKPLVGSGRSTVVELRTPLPDIVIAATDGLWKYAAPFEVLALATDFPDDATRLLEPLWLGSGGLPDDVTVVVARRLT